MAQFDNVTPTEWLAARRELQAREEEFGRAREVLTAARAQLPMVKVEKDYIFEGSGGKVDLSGMFEGRHQLIIYHFMFDPAWNEGCKHCSFFADNIGHLSHLHAQDTTLALVSRAPFAKISTFKARMGWPVPWYSSFESDFNYDYHVSQDEAVAPVQYNFKDKATLEAEGDGWLARGEQGGLSVFFSKEGTVYHTYSSYDGEDLLYGTNNFLDLTPLGRDDSRGWLRHHDKYDQ